MISIPSSLLLDESNSEIKNNNNNNSSSFLSSFINIKDPSSVLLLDKFLEYNKKRCFQSLQNIEKRKKICKEIQERKIKEYIFLRKKESRDSFFSDIEKQVVSLVSSIYDNKVEERVKERVEERVCGADDLFFLFLENVPLEKSKKEIFVEETTKIASLLSSFEKEEAEIKILLSFIEYKQLELSLLSDNIKNNNNNNNNNNNIEKRKSTLSPFFSFEKEILSWISELSVTMFSSSYQEITKEQISFLTCDSSLLCIERTILYLSSFMDSSVIIPPLIIESFYLKKSEYISFYSASPVLHAEFKILKPCIPLLFDYYFSCIYISFSFIKGISPFDFLFSLNQTFSKEKEKIIQSYSSSLKKEEEKEIKDYNQISRIINIINYISSSSLFTFQKVKENQYKLKLDDIFIMSFTSSSSSSLSLDIYYRKDLKKLRNKIESWNTLSNTFSPIISCNVFNEKLFFNMSCISFFPKKFISSSYSFSIPKYIDCNYLLTFIFSQCRLSFPYSSVIEESIKKYRSFNNAPLLITYEKRDKKIINIIFDISSLFFYFELKEDEWNKDINILSLFFFKKTDDVSSLLPYSFSLLYPLIKEVNSFSLSLSKENIQYFEYLRKEKPFECIRVPFPSSLVCERFKRIGGTTNIFNIYLEEFYLNINDISSLVEKENIISKLVVLSKYRIFFEIIYSSQVIYSSKEGKPFSLGDESSKGEPFLLVKQSSERKEDLFGEESSKGKPFSLESSERKEDSIAEESSERKSLSLGEQSNKEKTVSLGIESSYIIKITARCCAVLFNALYIDLFFLP